MVVTEEGLPLSYEVFEGNRADVTTLEEILDSVERKHGKLGRVWVFDRGL
jgi:transposase